MTDSSSTLHHLHWSSLVFDTISHGRQSVVPVLLAIFGAARGNMFWVWIALLVLVPTALISVFRYLTLRYSIQDRKLVVSQGLFFRNVRTVPVERIQNLDFVQNVLHRFFGVAELRVETAGGSEPEANLKVLSLDRIEQLRQQIFELKELQGSSDATTYPANFNNENIGSDAEVLGGPTHPSSMMHGTWNQDSLADNRVSQRTEVDGVSRIPLIKGSANPVVLLSIPTQWLLKAGIASNRGMVMVGIVIGLLLFQTDFFEKVDYRQVKRWLPDHWDEQFWIVAGIFVLLAGLVLLRGLSVVWYVLRFHGYQLVRRGEDLRISCGLLTKVNATVPRKRIQLISIHRNLLMRWMNLSSIRVETAGGSRNQNDASQSVSSRWFVPVVPSEAVPELMQQIRPGLIWEEGSFDFHPLAAQASWRRMRLSILLSIAIGLAGLAITRPWGWIAGVVSLPVLVFYGVALVRSMSYARTSEGIIFRSGVLTKKVSITFFEKIQSVELVETPLDRRWKMAQLVVDTAAAGLADHKIAIPMLDRSTAIEEHSAVTRLAALHQPVFR